MRPNRFIASARIYAYPDEGGISGDGRICLHLAAGDITATESQQLSRFFAELAAILASGASTPVLFRWRGIAAYTDRLVHIGYEHAS